MIGKKTISHAGPPGCGRPPEPPMHGRRGGVGLGPGVGLGGWGTGGEGTCYKVTKKMANPKQKAPENAKIHKN